MTAARSILAAALLLATPTGAIPVHPGVVWTDLGFRPAEDCVEHMRGPLWRDGFYWSVRPTWVCTDRPYQGGKIGRDWTATELAGEAPWEWPHATTTAGFRAVTSGLIPNVTTGHSGEYDSIAQGSPEMRKALSNSPLALSSVRFAAPRPTSRAPPPPPVPAPVPAPGLMLMALLVSLAALARSA